MLFEITVSANTVPMVSKTEPINQKFENTLKFYVVESKGWRNSKKKWQHRRLYFNLVQNSSKTGYVMARKSHFEKKCNVPGKAFFVGGGVNLSASTIAQRFDTLGPPSMKFRIWSNEGRLSGSLNDAYRMAFSASLIDYFQCQHMLPQCQIGSEHHCS